MIGTDLGAPLRLAFDVEQGGVPAAWLALLRDLDGAAFPHDQEFAGDLTTLAPQLHSFAFRLTGDRSAAEDLVQDTMMRAWSFRHRFEPGSNLKAWAFTIMKRIYLSARKRDRFVGEYSDQLEQTLTYGENQTATVLLGTVTEAIARLKVEYRVALTSVVIEEMTYDEAATMLDLPVGTVKSRVARARQALISSFDEDASQEVPEQAAAPTFGRARSRVTWREAKASGAPFLIG